jgi:hypothetical protein
MRQVLGKIDRSRGPSASRSSRSLFPSVGVEHDVLGLKLFDSAALPLVR